jgi:hypothetical protein
MDPRVRTAVLVGGLAFVALFAGMTLVAALEQGVNIVVVLSVAIILMLGLALIGALRDPPGR